MTAVPHFSVTADTGERVDYSTIWQQRNLVLIALPRSPSPETAEYSKRVRNTFGDALSDTAVVVTHDEIPGIPAPAAVVADRWGEVALSKMPDSVEHLPSPDELREWIEHVRQRCPECEGESR